MHLLLRERCWFPSPFSVIFIFQTETNLSKEMESVISNIKNTTQKKYMDYGRNPGSPDNDFLFMYSVARWGPSRSDKLRQTTLSSPIWATVFIVFVLK